MNDVRRYDRIGEALGISAPLRKEASYLLASSILFSLDLKVLF